MYMNNRNDEVTFIKNLIAGEKVLCPKCSKVYLEHYHKKAKKSNLDYICPSCNERYKVIKMMKEID